MSESAQGTSTDEPIVKIPRTMIDKILIGFGAIATVVFILAGVLLTWGASFSNDYVYDELSSQQIFFPDEESLRSEGRDDLVKFAGVQVTTGAHAEAYASYIAGHLENTADGMTYSQVPDRAARAAVEEAREAGASDEEIAELQAEADDLAAKRDTLFRGETLRGLLLSSYAWSTIGQIAGIAAWVAFAGALIMAVLVVAGIVHLKRRTA